MEIRTATRFGKLFTLGVAIALVVSVAPAAAATYTVDGAHSSAIFKIKHFGTANFYGAFHGISGSISYDSESPDASSIEISVAADSVSTGNDSRDGHIMSPDFLNAKQFPAITFKSSSVKSVGDGQFEVVGQLTLNGVTKEITATAEKTGEGTNPRSNKEIVGFESRITVDRTEFDMNFMAGPLSEEIEFLLSVEAAK